MADNSNLEIESRSNYWLHTARSVKVLGVNAFVVVPVLVLLFFPSLWLLCLTIAIVVLMVVLERFGYTPTVAFRLVRMYFAGKIIKRNRRIGSHRIWKK